MDVTGSMEQWALRDLLMLTTNAVSLVENLNVPMRLPLRENPSDARARETSYMHQPWACIPSPLQRKEKWWPRQ
jgi:hypothetical protein